MSAAGSPRQLVLDSVEVYGLTLSATQSVGDYVREFRRLLPRAIERSAAVELCFFVAGDLYKAALAAGSDADFVRRRLSRLIRDITSDKSVQEACDAAVEAALQRAVDGKPVRGFSPSWATVTNYPRVASGDLRSLPVPDRANEATTRLRTALGVLAIRRPVQVHGLGTCVRASIRVLSEIALLSGKTVQKHLKQLEDVGEVRRLGRGVFEVGEPVIAAGKAWQATTEHGYRLSRTTEDAKRLQRLRAMHSQERQRYRQRRRPT